MSTRPLTPPGTGTRRTVGVWVELRVIPVTLWSFCGIALGSAVAWDAPGRSGGWLGCAFVIGLLLQGVVAHAVNEITDWRSGTDRHPAPRVFSGGSKVVRAGLLDERDLTVLAVAGAVAATGLGVWAAAERGWWLLGLGAIGLLGAVAYTLPPVRAAYKPFAGETIAFVCVIACAIGGAGVQTGDVEWRAVLVGGAHAAYCVSMLMLHHFLDRVPDSEANPPKITSVVRLGRHARSYALAWSLAAALGWALSAIAIGPAALAGAVAAAVAVACQLRVDPDDPRSVTIAEAIVIAAGILGALTTAVTVAPDLAWVLALPLVAITCELVVQRRWIASTDPVSDDPTPVVR